MKAASSGVENGQVDPFTLTSEPSDAR
jgi:hypothetical protein